MIQRIKLIDNFSCLIGQSNNSHAHSLFHVVHIILFLCDKLWTIMWLGQGNKILNLSCAPRNISYVLDYRVCIKVTYIIYIEAA